MAAARSGSRREIRQSCFFGGGRGRTADQECAAWRLVEASAARCDYRYSGRQLDGGGGARHSGGARKRRVRRGCGCSGRDRAGGGGRIGAQRIDGLERYVRQDAASRRAAWITESGSGDLVRHVVRAAEIG